MKKILILCFLGDPTYPAGSISGTGGFNASVKDILNYLIDSPQFECILITNTMQKYTKVLQEEISKKIVLYRVCSPNGQSLDSHDVPAFITSVEEIIKDFSNISFIHSFYWMSGIVASSLSDKYNVPFIHTTVSLAKEKLRNGFRPPIIRQVEYENIFLSKAKYILAITEEEKRLLIDEYNLSGEKIIVEGQTVAEEYHIPAYNNYGIPTTIVSNELIIPLINSKDINIANDIWWNSKAFIFVGRITKFKGVDIIIQAWIALAERFDNHIPPLWIVGNTPYEIDSFRKELNVDAKILKKYEEENKIVWWGYLSPSAISTLYLKACVLVTHSAFESGGRMILEALCQGLPVITSNTGFGKDYIVNWLNGFVVNYKDINSLILRMSHFVRNPFLSNVLGSNAKKTFVALENMWHHKVRIVKIYEALYRGHIYIDETTSYIPITEDAFEKGMIETYPYYYLPRTMSNAVQVIEGINKEQDKRLMFSELTQIGQKDIWQYANKYVVKFMYSKLNKRKIWDVSQSESVLIEQNNLKKIEIICTLSPILKPLQINPNENFILMPFIKILSEHEIIQNYIAIANALSNISIYKDYGDKLSLASYWANTKKNIKLLNVDSINKLYSDISNKIKNHMEQILAPSTPNAFCIQYGQPILGHVGFQNGTITLLPTYHWVIAEKGLDAGLLLWEILCIDQNYSYHNELEILDSLSIAFDIPQHIILEWGFCICINHFIQDVVFENSRSKHNVYDTIIRLLSSVS